MKIKATYIAKKDCLGFETGHEYILSVGIGMFKRETLIHAEKENIRAKYGTLKAFLLNFDNITLIKE